MKAPYYDSQTPKAILASIAAVCLLGGKRRHTVKRRHALITRVIRVHGVKPECVGHYGSSQL